MTHILVVDDSPTERLRVGRLIEKGVGSVSISYAENGKAAYDSLQLILPDLIVTDLRMPEMDGLGLVERVTADGIGVPVILMTSFGNEEIALQALNAGAASYVPKAVLDKHLIYTLENVIALSQGKKNRQRVLQALTHVHLQFVLDNDITYVPPLISYLQEQMAIMRLFDESQLLRVGIALCETLTNAIHHGNLELDSEWRQNDEAEYFRIAEERRLSKPYSDRRVRMVATLSDQEVRFVIDDEGPGFKVDQIRDPTDEINMERMGGRGLLLIRSFMDQVTHNSTGNSIALIKNVVPLD
ncbi:MAG TPA: response regulator [Pirellula sp.]|nr:response regulator [Pirellula sp.]